MCMGYLETRNIGTMIKIQASDLILNIIPNTSQNSTERDFELLVDYVDAVKEIYDSLNIKKKTEN